MQMEIVEGRTGVRRLLRWLRERLVTPEQWAGGSLDGVTTRDIAHGSGHVTIQHLSPEELQAGLAQIEKAAPPHVKVSRNGRPEAA